MVGGGENRTLVLVNTSGVASTCVSSHEDTSLFSHRMRERLNGQAIGLDLILPLNS